MVQFRKLTAILCVLALIVMCFAGCSSEETVEPAEENDAASSQDVGSAEANQEENTAARSPKAGAGLITGLRLDENGNLQIVREPAKSEPMGEENTWTIFVYLCGSDLETQGAAASYDLQEMIDGSEGSAVRYVVLTGGAREWQNEVVDNDHLGLFLVENGEISLIENIDYTYMNDAETLKTFLTWGVENYPADKMGVIFWDHGGGSINGVCLDERFSDDIENGVLDDLTGMDSTLSLPAISSALAAVYENMTDQFEFVGYDACLMGTLENAFMLSSYARYMYASEESEPSCGWNYVGIGEAIGATGEIDGAELGKAVCDSYYMGCKEIEREKSATLSCIDLSEIDHLIMAFDQYAVQMMAAAENPSQLAQIVQNTKRLEYYGGNSDSEGYFNMVDLAGMVNAVSSCSGDMDAVLNAIDYAVVYSRNGRNHSKSCGLSVYYPLHVESGSQELSVFAEAAASPYYYGYVAQNAYAAANDGLDGYDSAVSLEAWASAMDADVENIVEDYGEAQITGASPYVEFYDEPQLFEDGSFGFSLTDESIPYISYVDAEIFYISDDGQDYIHLGSTSDVLANWDDGIFMDNFDGLWFCMPDGQLISATVVSETEEYTTYTTPVLLNGKETNLRFEVANADYTVTLDGVWNGIDENGLASRESIKLNEGDVIQPIFRATNQKTNEEYDYYGEEYIYDGSNEWFYNHLFDAEYLYEFAIYDIYGDYYITDYQSFTVKDGEIFFDMAA